MADSTRLDLSRSRRGGRCGRERARVSRRALSPLRRGRVARGDRPRPRARQRPPRAARAAARRRRRARVPSPAVARARRRPSRSRSRSRTSTCSSSSSPPDLQVLPAGPFSARTLLELVRSSDASRARRAPAHRLGRGTSGLIAFGKTARRPFVVDPPAARASRSARRISRGSRARAYRLVRGAATDRAHPARPADDSCRGRARPRVVDARARAAPRTASGRSSPRSRSRAGPIRSAFISRRPARRSSATRCSARAACRRATCRRAPAVICCIRRGSRSIIRTSGARIRLRSRPDWLADDADSRS